MNSTMGIWFLRVSNFQGYSKISSFSRDERFLRKSKIQNFTVPGQSLSKFQGCSRVSISRASRVKGSHLRVSTLVHTPMYLPSTRSHVWITSPLATTVGCVLGVRLECGPKWMVGRCPHSLHNPSQRLSLNIDCRLHDFCSD